MLFIAGSVPIGFDLSKISTVQATRSINSEDAVPTGMAFNNDGSKIYMVGIQNQSIHEYNLITPFDITSISGVQATESVSSEDTIPNGIAFNDDGSKIYMVGEQNDSIYEYNLSTPFSLSTISAVQVTESISSENIVPNGIAFNNNGSKIYLVGSSPVAIYEYNLTTPFDLSTISAVQVTKPVFSEDGNPRGIAFDSNGTKIFMVGGGNDSIYEYNLTTPFDLSTLSAVQVTESIASEDTEPEGIAFNNNGTKIYMIGAVNDSFNEYNLF